MRLNYICFITFFAFAAVSCSQTSKRVVLGKEVSEKELKEALSNQTQHNVVDNNRLLLSDEKTAVSVAEPILFNIYGESSIKKQQPYESYLVDNHWVIKGTLPEGYAGGTFLIILDARNAQILKITHGK